MKTASRDFEISLLSSGYRSVIGLDEVGRGCVAGNVTVGAAYVDTSTGPPPAGVSDSKLLSPSRRDALVGPLSAWTAGRLTVGHASTLEIDRFGIISALRLAGHRALASLPPAAVIVLDGSHNWLRAPDGWLEGMITSGVLENAVEIPEVRVVVKADRDVAVVAAASVYAKTVRDAQMTELDTLFPGYGFAKHKGYLTKEHTTALRTYGPCDVHRRSFTLPTC